MKKLNIVFCGTPDFSVPTLELIHQHPHINLVGVITMPDRPVGRGLELKSPPVAEYAKLHKLNLFQVENINREEEVLKQLETMNIDFILVLAFAQFLGSRILSMPKMGCFNIHTSILPKYRGAAPIQYALLNGDKSTGVSIQKMVKEMDAGDLVHFHELDIADSETGGQLYTRLKFQAALSTNDLITKILNNKITFTPQDKAQVSFAPTLKKEDGHLKFSVTSATQIKNQVRALDPWPGTYAFLGKQRLKILTVSDHQKKLSAGEVSLDQGMIVVGTNTSSLRLEVVQLEGKKVCSDTELLNGLKNKNIDFILS